jgi:neutral ceramidase
VVCDESDGYYTYFGDIITDVETASAYTIGSTVSVSFNGGNPRNIFQNRSDGTWSSIINTYVETSYWYGNQTGVVQWNYTADNFTFLEIQKFNGSNWETIKTDTDPYTIFKAVPILSKTYNVYTTTVTVEWITKGAAPGTYRIKYNGVNRNAMYSVTTGVYKYFKHNGTSSQFTLQ